MSGGPGKALQVHFPSKIGPFSPACTLAITSRRAIPTSFNVGGSSDSWQLHPCKRGAAKTIDEWIAIRRQAANLRRTDCPAERNEGHY
jgi:hypothetical protein